MEAMLQWSGTSRQRQSHSGTPQAAAAAPAPSRDPHAGHARLHGHLLLLSSYHTLKPCTRMSGLGARNCNVEAIKISSADFLQAPVPTRLFAGSSPPPRLEDEGKRQRAARGLQPEPACHSSGEERRRKKPELFTHVYI